ncbi:hypothetical protein ACGFSG_30520 [Streptomyces sp. NPDC048512]|uniref:hypothetical protein n=1 Tax=Streptomyces sp. NPDC048512 TaxID=3365563 RepID=UPI003719B709
MNRAAARVGVGTRFRYDGETVEVVEMAATTAGHEVVLKDGQGRLLRLSLKELLFSERAAITPDGPGPSADDEGEIACVPGKPSRQSASPSSTSANTGPSSRSPPSPASPAAC